MLRNTKRYTAAAVTAAIVLGISASTLLTASTAMAQEQPIGTVTHYKDAYYLSNGSADAAEDIYGGTIDQWDTSRIAGVVNRMAKVEALGDEDDNYNQKWRITWNLGDASNADGKGTQGMAYKYIWPDNWGRYVDTNANTHFSLMMSQDLNVINTLPDGTDVTPRWTAYKRGNPDKLGLDAKRRMWTFANGTWKNVEGTSTGLTNFYYSGQYKDADGNEAPKDWQKWTLACIAGSNTDETIAGSGYNSKCGDDMEMLNKSGKTIAAGVSDASDPSTRFRYGQDYNHSYSELIKFANQVGGIEKVTPSSPNDTVVSVEFTTHRTPWAGNANENVHRTWVAAHFKNNQVAYLFEGTQFKYVDTPEVDSDGDGLYDRFENGIGTCAYPVGSEKYNASPNCKGVANPKDTDGDGVEDGVEIRNTAPSKTDTGWKLEGSDPTVAPQKPSSPEKPTGKAGETVTGKTRPYMTVELYDLTNGKVIASTISDKDGNYTLTPGTTLARSDTLNKYSNNIKFASAADENSRTPQYWTTAEEGAGYTVPEDQHPNVAVRIWSDGMDNVGSTVDNRPQFTDPSSVLVSTPDIPATKVKDPKALTDEEKQEIKDKISKSIPNASNVKVNDDGSAVVTVNDIPYEIKKEDLVEQPVTVDPKKSSFAVERKDGKKSTPATGDEMVVKGTLKDDKGKVIAKRDLTVQLPDGSTVPATTTDDGTIVAKGGDHDGQPISFSAKAGDLKIYDGTSATGDPLFTKKVEVSDPTKAEIADAPSTVVAGDKVSGVSAKITDAAGNAVADGAKVYVKVPGSDTVKEATVSNGKISIPEFTVPADSNDPVKIEVFSDKDAKNSIGSKEITVTDKAIDSSNSSVSVKLTKDGDQNNDGKINPEDTVEVTGTIKDSEGQPIPHRTVTVKLPDGSTVPATTDDNGKIVGKDGNPITFRAGDDDGKVEVFDGSEATGKPVLNTPVKVYNPAPASATVSGGDTTGTVGHKINPGEVSITDKDGNPVPDDTTVYVKDPVTGKLIPVKTKDGKVSLPGFTPTQPGDYTVTVYSDPEGTKPIKGASKTIKVNEQPISKKSTLNVEPSKPTTGDKVTVTGKLVDEDGTPIAHRTLTVKLPDGSTVTATTDDNGNIVGKDGNPITFTAGENDGKIELFNGSEATGDPVLQKDVKVYNPAPASAKISDDGDSNGVVNHEVRPGTVTITDKDGNPVPDDTTVYVKDPVSGKLIPVKTKDGKVSLPGFTPTQPGDYTVTVYSDPEGTKPIKGASKTIKVSDQSISKKSDLAINPANPKPGDTVTVTGKLVEEDGTPIPHRTVTVKLPDGSTVTATTDDNGNIVDKNGNSITFKAGDNDGAIEVFDGTDTNKDPLISKPVVNDVPRKATFEGLPEDGKVTVANPVKGVTVKITRGDGTPVSDGTKVTYTDPEGKIVELTVSNGVVEIPAFTPSAVGKTKISLSNGDSEEPFASVPLEVQKQTPGSKSSITINPTKPNKGDKVTVGGKLVDENGNPIAGREVIIELPNGTKIPGITDKDGNIVGKDGNPITFIADGSGSIKVIVDGKNAAEAKLELKNDKHLVLKRVRKGDSDLAFTGANIAEIGFVSAALSALAFAAFVARRRIEK